MRSANILSATLAVLGIGCTKVVDINLHASDPLIVIEGEVLEGTGPQVVHLTRSVNFDQANDFPAVTDAVVTITDDQGNSATLINMGSGVYSNNTLVGQQGHTYTLDVVASGKQYSAQSTMPHAVPLDSIGLVMRGSGGGQGSGTQTIRYNVFAHYTDPAATADQYRFIAYVNGVREKESMVRDDRLTNGTAVSVRVRGANLNSGDSVRVELQCIDHGVYHYFDTFGDTGFCPTGNSAPANPESNISNGALGYFSAHTSSSLHRSAP